MKRLFAIFAIAVVFSACTNKAKEEAAMQAAVKAVKDSIRLDSLNKAVVMQKQEADRQKEVARVAEEKRTLMLAEQRASANAAPATSQTTTTTTTTKKKGWSSAAKGTLIGAGAGAVGGALIGKGKGAIIGGVAGAGAGYLIGRGEDKKSGRAQ
ncbi:YMGG-like glycine zipper-containing protein [Pedobacter sp. MC2016-14]|uniref:YMGG-like glycine zipper-containing protein n=1 Tax=Pedobacter sp. MC2016-14 TaxID=2897327 RepID=UPI001E3B86EB|nr:YMGG-like glycine zipper-containing protein [Pedobacter sp. MC2016-14]MCD0490228.1 YMGG-like glycine zipper-containing protein [Pedobacter sp. MC2016-14]